MGAVENMNEMLMTEKKKTALVFIPIFPALTTRIPAFPEANASAVCRVQSRCGGAAAILQSIVSHKFPRIPSADHPSPPKLRLLTVTNAQMRIYELLLDLTIPSPPTAAAAAYFILSMLEHHDHKSGRCQDNTTLA